MRDHLRLSLRAALLLSLMAGAPTGAQRKFEMPPPEVVEPGVGGVRIAADGIVANWYPANRNANGTVLFLGGSEGGIGSGIAEDARYFIDRGFNVMVLAYFAAPGLPDKLDMVPLEYFDRAIGWLKVQTGVDPRRIAIVSASKGAEAALIVAARHPELKAVAVGAPSAAVWPGIDFSGGPTRSSWSLAGKPVPYLRYGQSPTSIFNAYQSGLATLPRHPDAAIPVKSIRARVLLICGRSDTLWPSCPMARTVASELGSRAILLAYSDAGHEVFGPPVPQTASAYSSLGGLGGTPAGNNAARADAWPKLIAFLTDELATS